MLSESRWVNHRSEKSQGHRGHRKVKCEIGQALVMINLYVKFKGTPWDETFSMLAILKI